MYQSEGHSSARGKPPSERAARRIEYAASANPRKRARVGGTARRDQRGPRERDSSNR